jgi:DNA-binding MarR family transcriptional regulator
MSISKTILDDIPGYPAWLSVARSYQLCHRHLSVALDPLGLEVAHYDVLINVVRDEGLSQQVLARRLLVAKSNVSALLTVLERRGLIVRSRHNSDARLRLISLTPQGRELIDEAMRRAKRIVESMLIDITAEEAEAVRLAMIKMGAALEPPHQEAKQGDSAATAASL